MKKINEKLIDRIKLEINLASDYNKGKNVAEVLINNLHVSGGFEQYLTYDELNKYYNSVEDRELLINEIEEYIRKNYNYSYRNF